MKGQHITLFYKEKSTLQEKLREFFEEGISNSQRCVYLTTQNDAHQLYEMLKKEIDESKVTKYFSYYIIPDPVDNPKEFKEKISRLSETVFAKEFQGKIGFNVLGDISRFTKENSDLVEHAERHLENIKGAQLKMLCSLQVKENDFSRKPMLDIALRTHDHAIIEKEHNVFAEIELEKISNKD